MSPISEIGAAIPLVCSRSHRHGEDYPKTTPYGTMVLSCLIAWSLFANRTGRYRVCLSHLSVFGDLHQYLAGEPHTDLPLNCRALIFFNGHENTSFVESVDAGAFLWPTEDETGMSPPRVESIPCSASEGGPDRRCLCGKALSGTCCIRSGLVWRATFSRACSTTRSQPLTIHLARGRLSNHSKNSSCQFPVPSKLSTYPISQGLAFS